MGNRFDNSISAPPAFKEAKRETPDYLCQTLAIIPLSVGLGVAILIGGLLICWGLQISGHGALVLAGFSIVLAALYSFGRVWGDQLYMAIETITGHDLNQDGYIGEPIATNRIVTIEISNPDNNNLQMLQIPEPLFQKLPMIAHQLEMGKPFSEGAMTGSGRPLSRSEFHQLRDVLFDRGLAVWRDTRHPTQGVVLTARGKNVMRQLMELGRTTPPRMRTQGSQKVLPPGGWGGEGYDD